MLLQAVTLPREDICPCEEMYFRRSYGDARLFDDRIVMQLGDKIAFDTYFGSFYSAGWLGYTVADSFFIGIRAQGKARVTAVRRWVENGELADGIEFEETVEFNLSNTWYSPSIQMKANSVYSFSLTCSHEIFSFYGGAYCSECEPVDDSVCIALDVCTYKREEALKKTMNMLSKDIFRSQTSALRGHFGILAVDNGGTLGEHATKDGSVRIMQNRNLGGAGGFTRGIMEAVGAGRYTHVLLADDDAVINPDSLERLYVFLSLLRPEHRGITIGGALVQSELPWRQYEAGARWKGGAIEVAGHALDLRRVADVIRNGAGGESIDYAGWWFSCIPITKIRSVGLPLPLFIHRDDVEYSLRCAEVTVLPGICVWHEAFELKMSGTGEYYDLRNTAIVNALHCPQYNARTLIRFLGKWVTINLINCRYKYIDMNLEGIRDFLKGADYLINTDGAEIHSKVSAMNYTLRDITELQGFRGISGFDQQFSEQLEEASNTAAGGLMSGLKYKSLNAMTVLALGGSIFPPRKDTVLSLQPSQLRRCFRAGRIIHCNSDRMGFEVVRDKAEIKRCLREYREVCELIRKNYAAAAEDYRRRCGEMQRASFWREALGLN